MGAKKVHKNQIRLVQALPRVREAVPDARLVLAGAATPHESELRAEADRLGVGGAVASPATWPTPTWRGSTRRPRSFAFPSLNEGFGLPLLEAMGRDLPIVTSTVSSLPEVAGDAALLVDPTSVEEIADAISRVLRDANLRERLVAAGRERLQVFSWTRTAEETLASVATSEAVS